ncbi:glycosyltransferase [Spirosoma fluviale]|uniref:Rhamnosyltransferase n=1 Tax=Spirosoma fluviale TaxID=1597977 RepID=A0A286GJC2_9BACT|nr:glycosyltransferase [Spirosoma fluviale]SOD95084.1 rhamnosyltransferase [Spirosoma fluviale]
MKIRFNKLHNNCILIAGVVVLYNSKRSVIDNILSYVNQVDLLYIIDNSDIVDIGLVEEISSIHSIKYISIGSNKGIAYALNVAANHAIKDGFTHLLTMDDDSKAPKDLVKLMRDFLLQYFAPEKIGIISVAHSKPLSNYSYKKVCFTMTSGNLLSLDAYKDVGPFDDILFIDHVDHEYNLRLNLGDYEIIELSYVKLNHKLGVNKVSTLFGNKFYFISHSPIRLYYLVRNGIYIAKKYFLVRPSFCMKLLYLNLVETSKSLLLEDNKRKRIVLTVRAFIDGSRGKMGRVDY